MHKSTRGYVPKLSVTLPFIFEYVLFAKKDAGGFVESTYCKKPSQSLLPPPDLTKLTSFLKIPLCFNGAYRGKDCNAPSWLSSKYVSCCKAAKSSSYIFRGRKLGLKPIGTKQPFFLMWGSIGDLAVNFSFFQIRVDFLFMLVPAFR